MASTAAAAPNAAYDAVVQGMSCKQQPSGRMNCDYKVGEGLLFTVTGVGQVDVVVNFTKLTAESEFVAGVAPLHGCVIVRRARGADSLGQTAFVSPHDGRVYRNWNTCLRQAPKR